MGEGMFKKSAFEFKYAIALMRIFRTHPYPPCGVSLVRFLPTRARNEHINTPINCNLPLNFSALDIEPLIGCMSH